MTSRARPLLLVTLFGLLLAASPTQTALPAAGADPGMPTAGEASAREELIHPAADV